MYIISWLAKAATGCACLVVAQAIWVFPNNAPAKQ